MNFEIQLAFGEVTNKSPVFCTVYGPNAIAVAYHMVLDNDCSLQCTLYSEKWLHTFASVLFVKQE